MRKISEFLGKQSKITVQVHSVPDEVAPLAVEFQLPGAGSTILPVIVPEDRLAEVAGLFRSDVIELPIKGIIQPGRYAPPHIELKSAADAGPLRKTNPIEAMKDTTKLTGSLAVYPKSPLTSRNTWAVRIVEPNGYIRFISLSNRDKQEADKIEAKLMQALKNHPERPEQQRNIVVHPDITVTVKQGKMTIVPTQATLVTRAEDIEVTSGKR
jgi:hypothetical protein